MQCCGARAPYLITLIVGTGLGCGVRAADRVVALLVIVGRRVREWCGGDRTTRERKLVEVVFVQEGDVGQERAELLVAREVRIREVARLVEAELEDTRGRELHLAKVQDSRVDLEARAHEWRRRCIEKVGVGLVDDGEISEVHGEERNRWRGSLHGTIVGVVVLGQELVVDLGKVLAIPRIEIEKLQSLNCNIMNARDDLHGAIVISKPVQVLLLVRVRQTRELTHALARFERQTDGARVRSYPGNTNEALEALELHFRRSGRDNGGGDPQAHLYPPMRACTHIWRILSTSYQSHNAPSSSSSSWWRYSHCDVRC